MWFAHIHMTLRGETEVEGPGWHSTSLYDHYNLGYGLRGGSDRYSRFQVLHWEGWDLHNNAVRFSSQFQVSCFGGSRVLCDLSLPSHTWLHTELQALDMCSQRDRDNQVLLFTWRGKAPRWICDILQEIPWWFLPLRTRGLTTGHDFTFPGTTRVRLFVSSKTHRARTIS